MLLPRARAVVETLRDLFYPNHCLHCERAVSGDWLCPGCREDMREVPEPRCPVCSLPSGGTEMNFQCANCGDRKFHFETAVSALHARGVLRDLIHRLKYNSAPWLAEPLSDLLVTALREDKRLTGRTFDALVPVPLHRTRLRQREYNQAELLARHLSRKTGLPVRNALKRTRNTVTQTHFDREERMQNLRDAFSLRQNAGVQGQNLLLVDDVFTTGSTLDECARALTSAGAKTVCALTLARG